MNFVVAWAIAISSPALPEYLFMSTLFESELSCQRAVSRFEVEDPVKVSCHEVVVWTPKKPIDI